MKSKTKKPTIKQINNDLLEALQGLVCDWERVHGPIPNDHEAKAAIAQALLQQNK